MTSPAKLSTDGLDDKSLAHALRSLHDSGMATIENAYTADEVATLRDAYDALLDARPTGKVQPTDGEHHVQMQMPLVPPFSDPTTVAHPVVTQILSIVLGPDFECSYYNSNTAYPGSTYQRVHRDSNPIFGVEQNVATPPTGIVVNIPLCDFTLENGSTEVWPATHLIVDTPDDVEIALDDRTKVLASSRLNVKAGSIVLRDLRVWHRGVPNNSDHQRSMLAIVYKRHFLGWRHKSLRVPQSTWDSWSADVRSIFENAPIDAD
jgi:hypothetical protein